MEAHLLRNDPLAAALEEAERRFVSRTPQSREWHERAAKVMPGGNTRTVLHFAPYPIRVARGYDQRIIDIDGNAYTDFLGEYSAGLYGHSHPVILAAAREALNGGIVLAGPNRFELQLAEAVTARFPSIELVRFTNSGTEANLMALGAARAHTGRNKILVFEGAYHGGVLSISSQSVPLNPPFEFIVGTYNDFDATSAVTRGFEAEIAAILVEPLMGSGCIPAQAEFLLALRDFATRHDIVLIFDEVMTSRIGRRGLQGEFGITPDMTTLGKYLGGGFSFGAFGGQRDIMNRFDPTQPTALAHAGTFNNNVLSMASGLAGLSKVYTEDVAERHTQQGDAFRARLNAVIAKRALPAQVTGRGTLLCVHFHEDRIRSPADTSPTRDPARALFHLEMLERGFYVAARSYMALSLALTDDDFDSFCTAFDDVLSLHGDPLCSR